MFKNLVVCCVVSLSASALASYELVLAADYNSGVVRRFDGNSGVPLGSFGAGQLNLPTAIYADASSGMLYVSSLAGGFSVFNYSTGSFVNSMVGYAGMRGIRPCTAPGYEGQFLFTTSSTVYRGVLTPTWFGVLASYSTGPLNGNGAVQLSNGNIVTAESSGVLRVFSPGGTLLSTSSVATGYVPATDWVGTLDLVGSTLIMSSTNSSTLGRINRATISGSTVTWGTTNTFALPSGLTQIAGSTNGHGGRLFFTAVNPAVTTGQIIRYDTVLNTSYAMTSTGSSGPFGLTSIVAPEPSSLAAFGLAGLLLLRRRGRP